MEAQRALSWLRGSAEVHEEMYEMSSECESQKLLPTVTLREIISNNALRIPLIIALTMMLAQQLSGINAVSIIFCLLVNEKFKPFFFRLYSFRLIYF